MTKKTKKGKKTGRGPHKYKNIPPPRVNSGPRRTYPPYEIAKYVVQNEAKVQSRAEYYYWHRTNKITHLPSAPIRFYKDEWQGWGDFLGTGNIFAPTVADDVSDCLVPFWDAARWVQSLGLKNQVEWREYYKNNPLPKGIPKNPAKWYPEHWEPRKGWDIWLGRDSLRSKESIVNKVEVEQKAAATKLVVLFWDKQDPNNVFTIYHTTSLIKVREMFQDNTQRVFLACYDLTLPQDLETFHNRIQASTTNWYGEEAKRLTPNWNQLKWGLDSSLLVVRV